MIEALHSNSPSTVDAPHGLNHSPRVSPSNFRVRRKGEANDLMVATYANRVHPVPSDVPPVHRQRGQRLQDPEGLEAWKGSVVQGPFVDPFSDLSANIKSRP